MHEKKRDGSHPIDAVRVRFGKIFVIAGEKNQSLIDVKTDRERGLSLIISFAG